MLAELPGIERIRKRFVEMLDERQTLIATHGLAAWDGTTVDEIKGNLASAQAILHQIAGSAGSLGFEELGRLARQGQAAERPTPLGALAVRTTNPPH